MKMLEFGSFPIADIVIGERLRQVDENWVAALAPMIEASTLQHPISIVKFPDGSYRLGAGAHRLAAVKQLGWTDVPAHIYEPETQNPELELRLLEVTENVGRRELSALDRAGHIAELEATLKQLHPHMGHGGDRRSKDATDQVAMFAIRKEIAEKIGIGERTVRSAVALWNNLSPDTRAFITEQKLDIANNQAQLRQLSQVMPDKQTRVLLHLAGEEGHKKVAKVADALSIIENRIDPKNPTQEQYDKLLKAWAGAGTKARRWFLDTLAERGALKRGGYDE